MIALWGPQLTDALPAAELHRSAEIPSLGERISGRAVRQWALPITFE
jgi:hypothetical protein